MQWLAEAAASTPSTLALDDDTDPMTYADLDAMARQAAGTARDQFALEPGGAVVVDSSVEMIPLMWGLWEAGVAVAPIEPQTPDAARHAATLRPAAVVTERLPDRGLRWEAPPPPAEPALHTAVLTSGSAQRRLVELTHGNVRAAVAASQLRLGNGPEDRWLLVLPLAHVGGLSVLWRSAAAGGTVRVHDGFRAASVADDLHTGRITVASLVPTMLFRLLEQDPGPYRGEPTVLLGGGPAPRRLVERGLDAGLEVLTTYGMTEACSQISTVLPGQAHQSVGTVGVPLEGMDVGIVDGEIVIDGPAVSGGYVSEPRRTGRFHTGDAGRFDAEGRLVVTGRRDEMVVTGGENVAPDLVEAAIADLPPVAEALVGGVPDPEWGEIVVAAVVVRDVFDEARAKAALRGTLAPHEIPKRWIVVDELPILPSGKRNRRALADLVRRLG